MSAITGLSITYAITADDPDGEPWLPSEGGFWVVTARARGFTKWRRITLQEEEPSLPNKVQS